MTAMGARCAWFVAVGGWIALAGCAQGTGRGEGNPKGTPGAADSDAGADAGGGADVDAAPPDDDAATLPDAQARDGGGRPDAELPDAAAPPDAGQPVPDAHVPPAECVVDDDCDDGLGCNGTEQCAGGSCRGSAAMNCGDAVTCTTDSCVEPGTCRHVPVDAACGAGALCDTTAGCVAGCAESPCRLVGPQCGCDSGEGCYLVGGGLRVCATAGARGEGDACASPADCAPGLQCVNVAATGSISQCARFCTTNSDCSGVGSACVITLGDGTSSSGEASLCSRDCNAVTQAGCGPTTACHVYADAGGSHFTDCSAPVGAGAQGAACADDGGCMRGHACVDPDGTDGSAPKQCLHWCDVATGAGCGVAERCFGFGTPARVGSRVYGLCF